jgi:hypothetical protein
MKEIAWRDREIEPKWLELEPRMTSFWMRQITRQHHSPSMPDPIRSKLGMLKNIVALRLNEFESLGSIQRGKVQISRQNRRV